MQEKLFTREDEIQVWSLKTNQPPQVVAELLKWLSPEERRWAAQFVTPMLSSRFTVQRASLRILLGKVLGMSPDRIIFGYAAYGKPQILGGPLASGLEFNLSHSNDMTQVAIAWRREVGIDIECFDSSFDAEKLVERCCCPSERQVYLDAAEADRATLFLQAWTRKEAYLKATGDGLSFPLHDVQVSIGIGVPPRLIHVEGRPTDPEIWAMVDLEMEPGCIGVLVVKGRGWRLQQLEFDPSASDI